MPQSIRPKRARVRSSEHPVSAGCAQGAHAGVHWSRPTRAQAEAATVIGSRSPVPSLPAPQFGGRDVMGQEPSSFWVFRRNSRALTIVGALGRSLADTSAHRPPGPWRRRHSPFLEWPRVTEQPGGTEVDAATGRTRAAVPGTPGYPHRDRSRGSLTGHDTGAAAPRSNSCNTPAFLVT